MDDGIVRFGVPPVDHLPKPRALRPEQLGKGEGVHSSGCENYGASSGAEGPQVSCAMMLETAVFLTFVLACRAVNSPRILGTTSCWSRGGADVVPGSVAKRHLQTPNVAKKTVAHRSRVPSSGEEASWGGRPGGTYHSNPLTVPMYVKRLELGHFSHPAKRVPRASVSIVGHSMLMMHVAGRLTHR